MRTRAKRGLAGWLPGLAAALPALAGAAETPLVVQTTPALRKLGGQLVAASALSPGDIWAAGSMIAHFDGRSWSIAAIPANKTPLTDISMDEADDGWTVGTADPNGTTVPLAEHWNGLAWAVAKTAALPKPASFATVDAVASNDVWIGGNIAVSHESLEPLFEHWDGNTWTVAPQQKLTGFNFIQKIAGTGANDLWAVGYALNLRASNVPQPLIEHFDGKSWQQVAAANPGVGGQLNGVVAIAANNAWAVGSATVACGAAPGNCVQTLAEHWDGQAWQIVSSPTIDPASPFQRDQLFGIAALSDADIWAAGGFVLPDGSNSVLPLLQHWDGTAWRLAPSPNVGLASLYFGVATAAPSSLVLVGSGAFGGGEPFSAPLIAAASGR